MMVNMENQQEEEDGDSRITELILISSMYPTQLKCLDDNIQRAVDEENFHYQPEQQKQSINVILTYIDDNSDDLKIEINLTMPFEYPNIDPNCLQIYCRIDHDDKNNLQKLLNERIKNEIKNNDKNSLINVVTKIIEILNNIKTTMMTHLEKDSKDSNSKSKNLKDSNLNDEGKNSRYWIYSHHIYSMTKRKSIIDYCRNHQLNGFMLIGKPGKISMNFSFIFNTIGFICVEGTTIDCYEFWKLIRSWNWQRLQLIDKEEQVSSLIFEKFNEYIERSNVFRYLEQKNYDKIIKNYLGI